MSAPPTPQKALAFIPILDRQGRIAAEVSKVEYLMHVTTGHNLANTNLTPPGRVISAVSMEEFLHRQDFRVAKSQSGIHVSALGILEKALDYV